MINIGCSSVNADVHFDKGYLLLEESARLAGSDESVFLTDKLKRQIKIHCLTPIHWRVTQTRFTLLAMSDEEALTVTAKYYDA
jgi:hypothetical protein